MSVSSSLWLWVNEAVLVRFNLDQVALSFWCSFDHVYFELFLAASLDRRSITAGFGVSGGSW